LAAGADRGGERVVAGARQGTRVLTRIALIVSGALVGLFIGGWAGDRVSPLFEDADTLAGIA
jgi:uncharacterized membrane protein YcjF (UPF0283 family)